MLSIVVFKSTGLLVAAFRFQLNAIRRNIAVFLLMVLACVVCIYVGVVHHDVLRVVAYLLTMWLCAYMVDVYTLRWPPRAGSPVRNPKRETGYFIANLCLGGVFFLIRFSPFVDWEKLPMPAKWASILLLMFVFPVVLAVVLLLLKYKPADLGLRLRGWPLALPIVLMLVVASRLVTPGGFTFDAVMAEAGTVPNLIFMLVVTIGWAEEFFRFVGQTRIGAALRNNGVGWLVATVLWALVHAPKWYSDNGSATETLLNVVGIVPIGLMWGYMTHRTKSFVPALLVHATNFWGLQNF